MSLPMPPPSPPDAQTDADADLAQSGAFAAPEASKAVGVQSPQGGYGVEGPSAAPAAGDTRSAPVLPIRAVVMLAGSVRANHLRRATGRSPLEMPLASHRTVIDVWLEEVEAMARQQHEARGSAGGGGPIERLPVRVMVDQHAVLEADARQYAHLDVTVERDPSAYRGTGGLLHDLARSYRDTDRMLVLHGSQVPFHPLADVVKGLGMPGAGGEDADVSLVCDVDGEPAGVVAIQCRALRAISPVGYIDFNEQALPKIAKVFDVRVKRSAHRLTRSIRTLSGYLETLRAYSRREAGRLTENDPFAEEWQASFQIAEGGAAIDETAIIHDSVVLAGARVDAGAVIVRSVICPGVVIARGQSVVDRVVSA